MAKNFLTENESVFIEWHNRIEQKLGNTIWSKKLINHLLKPMSFREYLSDKYFICIIDTLMCKNLVESWLKKEASLLSECNSKVYIQNFHEKGMFAIEHHLELRTKIFVSFLSNVFLIFMADIFRVSSQTLLPFKNEVVNIIKSCNISIHEMLVEKMIISMPVIEPLIDDEHILFNICSYVV